MCTVQRRPAVPVGPGAGQEVLGVDRGPLTMHRRSRPDCGASSALVGATRLQPPRGQVQQDRVLPRDRVHRLEDLRGRERGRVGVRPVGPDLPLDVLGVAVGVRRDRVGGARPAVPVTFGTTVQVPAPTTRCWMSKAVCLEPSAWSCAARSARPHRSGRRSCCRSGPGWSVCSVGLVEPEDELLVPEKEEFRRGPEVLYARTR